MKEKVCIYTCITGNYDDLHEVEKEEGIDYICFTNNINLKSQSWKIVFIKDDNNLGNMILSRKIKILGHPLIENNYDISIWVDGAIQVRGNIKQFLNEYCALDKYSMACFRHRLRDCVYEEAAACIIHRKEDACSVKEYLEFIENEKFPHHYGLAECTVLVRRHGDIKVKQTMQLWFEMFLRFAKRDQLTFPYTLWETGLGVSWINLNVFDNPWFFWHTHKQEKETSICRIFFGEYKDVFVDKYLDKEMEFNEDKRCKIHFFTQKECDNIAINLGKHFGKVLTDFQINISDVLVSFFPGITIYETIVFDYDDLVIYIKGNFYENQEIIVSFEMDRPTQIDSQEFFESIIDRYYYDKLVRDNMITYLNQRCDWADKKFDEMNRELKKYNKLFEKQDLLTKIVRRMFLKVIHE